MKSTRPPSIHAFEAPKLDAIIEIMFLAAFADGDFGDEERAFFLTNIESLTDRNVSRGTMSGLIEQIEARLAAEGRAARLVALKAQLPDPGARKAALGLAIQLTAADGIIRTSERELILEVAEALEIDSDTAADMVAKVAPP